MRRFAALFSAAIFCATLSQGYAATGTQTTFHRTAVQDKTPDGYFLGRSTKGGFRVELPIAFNDVTLRTPDTNIGDVVIHAIGGKSADNFLFTAMATERTPKMKDVDMRQAIKDLATGGMLPEVRSELRDGVEMLAVHFADRRKPSYVLLAKTNDRFFSLTCEYPLDQAAIASRLCGHFLRSFKIDQ